MGGGIQDSGGSTVKINAQIMLALPLTTFVPLTTIDFLSSFDANAACVYQRLEIEYGLLVHGLEVV